MTGAFVRVGRSALVVFVEPIGELEQLVQRWLPADRLRPVRSDPNRVLQYWRFTELDRPRQHRGSESGHD